MSRQQRLVVAIGLVASLLASGVLIAALAGARMNRQVTASSGGRSASGEYVLDDSAGELAAGQSASASYRLTSGCWHGTIAGPPVIVSLPEHGTIPVHGSYTAPVFVDDVTDRAFTSLEMVLTYDGSVVYPVDVGTEGTMTEGWTAVSSVQPGGGLDTLRVTATAGGDTLRGAGILFRIEFNAAIGALGGSSTMLHFERFAFNGMSAGVSAQDGAVHIVVPYGDATGNGDVTSLDASVILRHTVGLLRLAGNDSVAADVTGDGGISAYDGSLVLLYVVGAIARFPVEEGYLAKVVYAPRAVWMGPAERSADGGWRVSVRIDEMEGVVAGELALSFSGGIEDLTVGMSERMSECMVAHSVEESRIRVSFAGDESGTGGGAMLELILDESDVDPVNLVRLDHVSLNEGMVPIRNVGREAKIPTAYRLAQNHPNPFNPETTVRYDLPQGGMVHLRVYALTGQVVRTLVAEERAAGSHSATWDGTNDAGRAVASGVYLYRMEAGDYRAVRKMLLIR